MFTWLRRKLGRGGGAKTLTSVESLVGGVPLHRFTDYESYLRAGSRKVWATWKACDIVGQSVSTTPFQVFRVGGTVPVTVDGLSQLLTYPNPRETFGELLYKTTLHIKLTGNAYWLKDQPNLSGDLPKALYGLNPKRVSIVPGKKGEVIGYMHRINGLQIPLDVQDVIHFRRPHPDNDYYGLGDIEPGEDLFNDHINRQTWAAGFWKNGAAPSGVLLCEDQVTDQDEWDKAKARWQKEYGGAGNSGKTAWLTGKWSYQQLGLSAQEMQNIEQSKLNAEQIFIMHGVPLSVAGVQGAANYAVAEIDDMRYRTYTVRPLVQLIEDTVNTDLVKGWGPQLVLKFALGGLINAAQVITAYAPVFDRGAMSINELREKVGLQPDRDNPLWEAHYVSAGLTPLDLAGVGANLEAVGEQAKQIVSNFVADSTRPRWQAPVGNNGGNGNGNG